MRLKLAFWAIVLFFAYYLITGNHPLSIQYDILGTIGAVVVIFGALLRSWAAGSIHKNKILSTSGAYALFRHPLYSGSFFIALGFSLIMNSIFLYIILFAFVFFVYLPKIHGEESYLANLYPTDWKTFTAKVSIFGPKCFPKGMFDSTWSFSRWKSNKEYEGFFTSLLGLLLMYFWNVYCSVISNLLQLIK